MVNFQRCSEGEKLCSLWDAGHGLVPRAATCGGGASDEEEGGHARGPEEARCTCSPSGVAG